MLHYNCGAPSKPASPVPVTNDASLLLQLSPECVAAAEDVDLVVVEGMGRAIETNLYASFSCDSLKLAMVKHPEVKPLHLQLFIFISDEGNTTLRSSQH